MKRERTQMFNEDDIPDFIKAGKIAETARDRSKKIVKPGAKIIDIAESIEGWIKEEGGSFGFPANISINNIAAHYTPPFDDTSEIPEDAVVKIDLGASVNGCVGDTAYTLDFSGEHRKLLEASEQALENIINHIKSGINVGELGEIAEETIAGKGVRVIRNLSGHRIERNLLHGASVPMIKGYKGWELEEGMAIAIEPFASTGNGNVKEGARTEIFMFQRDILTRNLDARNLLENIKREFKTLPFAERWIIRDQQTFKWRLAMRELITRGALHPYPVLLESAGSRVAQFEKTLLVEKDSCRILT